jgi:hypothetical protein
LTDLSRGSTFRRGTPFPDRPGAAHNPRSAAHRPAAEPEVYFVKVDVNGTLLRLVAACTDAVSADRLAQKTLARAAQVVHRASL